MTRGVIIGAPASSSGKTTVTLGVLRALRHAGFVPRSAKVGPDYLDPKFHTAATGAPSYNLDSWAMREETLAQVALSASADSDVVIVEGVMGLFDGAGPSDGSLVQGSTADVARRTGWPVILVVDASGMAASVAALVHGFATYHRDVNLVGVIFNQVGSERHDSLLRQSLSDSPVEVLGALPRDDRLSVPSRHLGLVNAEELASVEEFIDDAARIVAEHLDLERLMALATPLGPSAVGSSRPGCALPPLGQHIAVARDIAFTFCYPTTLDGWRASGATIEFFSPLENEAPSHRADAVYLPGGYPELHAGRLASASHFLTGLRAAAERNAFVYGECGGYMALGETLIDKCGERHRMSGLLPVNTSFAEPRMTLGYREITTLTTTPLGPRGAQFRGHEFHFAQTTREARSDRLFSAANASGDTVVRVGHQRANVSGSFMHLIDQRR
ncbi:MAG: cobyrinate a,c-diamide synthase [Pseudomonadota bacterium]